MTNDEHRGIPRPRRHLPPSIDQAEYERYRELEDVDPIKEEIATLAAHVRDAWFEDEINRGLATLAQVNYYLDHFAVLAQAHRDRVVGT
jgi:hypothetical protein